MKRLFSVFCFLLLALTAFAADTEPTTPAVNPWQPLLDLLGGNSGRLLQIIALIGALRIPVKLFSSQLQSFFERALARIVETADRDDDHLAEIILSNPVYRFLAFLVDMVTSLKLPLDLPVGVNGLPSGDKQAMWVTPVALAVLLGALSFSFVGCSTLAKDGPYQGNKILYTADQSITGAYDTLHAFVKWEYRHRATVSPEVTAGADEVRLHAQQWISGAILMRDLYAASPTEEQRLELQSALMSLRAALEQARHHMARPPNQTATN
jgi:hypothetical protein